MRASNPTPLLETNPLAIAARRTALLLLRMGVGVGLLAYLAKFGIIDLHALTKLFSAWPITMAGVGLLLIDVTFMAFRLSCLFRPHGLHLPLGRSVQLTLVSFFFSTFLPGAAGGDLAKVFYAAKENTGRRTEIVTVVLFDRAVGLFTMLLLPLLFASLFSQLIRAVPTLQILLVAAGAIASCLLASFLICLFHQPLVNQFAAWLSGWLPGRTVSARVLATIGAYRRSPGSLLVALGASLVANLTLVGVTALAILALNPAWLSTKMCLVIPMGFMANSLPVTPGGLGVGETAFNALFRVTGLRGGAEALLCWRIWTVLVGLLGLLFYVRGLGRSIFDAGDEAEKRPSGECLAAQSTAGSIRSGAS
jgi:uncharacterized membrane protein YbhN (UPF0104 family)